MENKAGQNNEVKVIIFILDYGMFVKIKSVIHQKIVTILVSFHFHQQYKHQQEINKYVNNMLRGPDISHSLSKN